MSLFTPRSERKPKHLKNKGPGTAKFYSKERHLVRRNGKVHLGIARPGSGLLTEAEITRRRGGNPKGAY